MQQKAMSQADNSVTLINLPTIAVDFAYFSIIITTTIISFCS